ncbi:MAG: enoyl-CoA hydratase-related protein [Henriciella sp.]
MILKETKYAVDGPVATITLSRPKRRNAWTGGMHAEYRHCLSVAEQDPDVRTIIVTGDPEGKAFCVGADLSGLEIIADRGEYSAGIDDTIAMPGYGTDAAFDATFAYHFGLSKPVIAAVNGAAAGIGLVLAAFCDLRFTIPGAKFTTAHGRFNFPAEYGLSWVLPRLVGTTFTNDVMLSSRIFTSDEAHQKGFSNQLVPENELMQTVDDYARMLARTVSPGALRETKRQIYMDWHRSVASSVEDSERLLVEMSRHPDNKEGVAAWMEKRTPKWHGGNV